MKFVYIDLGKDEDKNWYDFYLFKVDNTYNYDSILSSDEGFISYYEALNKAIEKALKLIYL